MASDAELIGRSLAGDGEAFMEVVCRHEIAIGAYLERRVGREAAEDLLGDVWVAAFESRRTYDQSFAEARPWLYTMALNRLRHYWRSRPAEDLVPDVTGLAIGWDPWPAVDVRVDTRTVFRAAVAGLRSEEREVLTLVAGEDLTVADAARVLGMPAGTARRLLHQARTALRNTPEVAALLIGTQQCEGKQVNVDEMDLASQALDVAPWRPEAYERARARLRGAMAESGPRPEAAPVPAVAPLRGRGFSRAGRPSSRDPGHQGQGRHRRRDRRGRGGGGPGACRHIDVAARPRRRQRVAGVQPRRPRRLPR